MAESEMADFRHWPASCCFSRMLRRIGRLFVIKNRFEAIAVIYALGLGAVDRGLHYLRLYPGTVGWLLFLACLIAVFMAGARLLEFTRKDSGERRRKTDFAAQWPNSGGISQLAELSRREPLQPDFQKMAIFRQKIRLARALHSFGHQFHDDCSRRPEMFNIADLSQTVLAAAGAILLTGVVVAASADTLAAPAGIAQAQVSAQAIA